jgi:hypothetical protein
MVQAVEAVRSLIFPMRRWIMCGFSFAFSIPRCLGTEGVT